MHTADGESDNGQAASRATHPDDGAGAPLLARGRTQSWQPCSSWRSDILKYTVIYFIYTKIHE